MSWSDAVRGRKGQLLPWRRRVRPGAVIGNLPDVSGSWDLMDLFDVPVVGLLFFILFLPVIVFVVVPVTLVVLLLFTGTLAAFLLELALQLALLPLAWTFRGVRALAGHPVHRPANLPATSPAAGSPGPITRFGLTSHPSPMILEEQRRRWGRKGS